MRHKCCVCWELPHSKNIVGLVCGHLYCTSCLRDFFVNATDAASLFPPKCCATPIPLRLAEGHMTKEELDRYRKAEVQFLTASWTRCSNAKCGASISPDRITAYQARCPDCRLSTCIWCKAASHPGEECAAELALRRTLALGKRLGWKQCPNCKALIEKRDGCDHMKCRCMAMFCYKCGGRHGSCRC
ncbi:uncharacterized protein BO97DRAFT_338563 [Aspergillus homomorphus CBS 101889]|uniref:RBR-type E3 ubiquitin transferase n=1 Tax=Aspergillus homomorphus (strain CBS 101889) TaxID=1450537 RepID=A0A395I567_ASPHC|nr:hypothetical protein BO97DRAFT_338563 [Aspergillus homomorphus CBS 101889]RAL15341.1 hypothetical protein BO97DRAFT_338563 [Aspergillus homomorphus CBS 101889]